MKNKGDRGGCYLDYGDLPNSSFPKKAELINCFIIHSK